METVTHDTVLQAGSVKSRLAKVYAEALLSAAQQQNAVDSVGDELAHFVSDVLNGNPTIESFLSSPIVGKKAKSATLHAALAGRSSELLRGLLGVLTKNLRLDLMRGIAAAYHQLLDNRAGRVPVKVTTATDLSEAQRNTLNTTLSEILKHDPMVSVRVDPDLIGGMIVQIGDRVIDTSIRTRLQSLRHRLLESPK